MSVIPTSNPPPPPANLRALDALLSRRSLGIKYLTEPGPDDAQLRLMAEAALHAPDHAGLVPFRFAIVRGSARGQMAALYVRAARDAGKDEASVRLDAERALRAPVTLAVIARLTPGHAGVPLHEQWACVGGALTNVLNAAHALGFGAKMLSGSKARDPNIVRAFCGAGESLVGWIALGTPVRPVGAPPAKNATTATVMAPWQPPPG